MPNFKILNLLLWIVCILMIEIKNVLKHPFCFYRRTFRIKLNRFYIAIYRSSEVTFSPVRIAFFIIITTVHP